MKTQHLVLIAAAVLLLPIALWVIESVMDARKLAEAQKPFTEKARAEENAREAGRREVDARLAAGNAVSKKKYDDLIRKEEREQTILKKALEKCQATKIGEAAVLRCVINETQ